MQTRPAFLARECFLSAFRSTMNHAVTKCFIISKNVGFRKTPMPRVIISKRRAPGAYAMQVIV
ncbi:uncharacterized protein MYCFIDRAFT_170995 [Pseudocercospora fijiensis CIRAD86]|uniref:Uncharacterized protein n=1 Tax=Pseudocercospora fijiensis (strain CIRAD86) TaxID=383855 RepID=N1Q9K9_PSEFD|nr:uncharacterized protein MYCFIDRAFT_170995 [Pseudocercospora fijiensis CIRAD86]EME89559.1 hypothetical protein MYCFIDRAFT_170995 [Pseudocercospora fijiensis CIRAD86]